MAVFGRDIMALLKGEDGSALQIRVADGYIQWKLETDSAWKNVINTVELKGADGKNIELQVSDTHIQWRVVGDAEWINLIALANLKGENGKSIEMQRSTTHIQWRVVGDAEWINLIALADLKGADGRAATITIGDVTTLPAGSKATAENVGTDTDAIINFGIPQGEKGESAEVEIIDFGEQVVGTTFPITSEQLEKMKSNNPPLVKVRLTKVFEYYTYEFTLSRLALFSNAAYYGGAFATDDKAFAVGMDAHGTSAFFEVREIPESGGTPVIDLGEVTLTTQSLGGISMSMADNIEVTLEQATLAQANVPPVVKIKFNGGYHEFCRTEISTDASAAYIYFAATEDMGEGTRFYNLQITISGSGGASAILIVWKYDILQGLNSAYEAGGLTFENGVATKTLSEEEASLFGGEGVYNQIRFWDTNASNELYILYASHNNRGASLINSHKCDYFGIVENASVTGEGGGITAFAAYLDDTTLTIKQINLGGGGGAGGGLTVTEVEYTSGQDFSAVLNSLPAEFWSKRIISVQNSGQNPCIVIEGSGQSWSSDFCGMCFNVGNTKFTMMTYAMQQPDETNIFSYPVHISGVRQIGSWGASVIPLGLTMADSEPIMNAGIKMSGNGKFVFYTQEA